MIANYDVITLVVKKMSDRRQFHYFFIDDEDISATIIAEFDEHEWMILNCKLYELKQWYKEQMLCNQISLQDAADNL